MSLAPMLGLFGAVAMGAGLVLVLVAAALDARNRTHAPVALLVWTGALLVSVGTWALLGALVVGVLSHL